MLSGLDRYREETCSIKTWHVHILAIGTPDQLKFQLKLKYNALSRVVY